MFAHGERFGETTLTLPLFTQMTVSDTARVCRVVDEIPLWFAK